MMDLAEKLRTFGKQGLDRSVTYTEQEYREMHAHATDLQDEITELREWLDEPPQSDHRWD